MAQKPQNKSNSDMPHAFVKYLDSDGNTEYVPVCNIPEVTYPDFEEKAVYDVFWSPNHETLPDARKKLKNIERFPAGSGYDKGAGYYPGTILKMAGTIKELKMNLEIERLKEPTLKAIENMTSASTNGGVNNIGSTKCNRRGNTTRGGKAGGGSKVTSALKKRKFQQGLEDEDDSDDQTIIPLKISNEKIKELEDKYCQAKATIRELKNKLEKMQEERDLLVGLNLVFQKHIVNCEFPVRKPESSKSSANEEESSLRKSTSIVLDNASSSKEVQLDSHLETEKKDTPNCSVKKPGTLKSSANDEGSSWKKSKSIILDNASSSKEIQVDSHRETKKKETPNCSVSKPGTSKSSAIEEESSLMKDKAKFGDKASSSNEVQLDSHLETKEKETPNNFNLPQKPSAVTDEPPHRDFLNLNLLQGPSVNDELSQSDDETSELPRTGDAGNHRDAADEENAPDLASSKVEIYPKVRIDKSAWDGAFKKYVVDKSSTLPEGVPGDKMFVRTATMIMWSADTLITHSVSGRECNANVAKAAKPGEATPGVEGPLPPLEESKVNAILGALHRRVLMEGADPNEVAKRVTLKFVRRFIGEARNNVRKAYKRNNNPTKKNPEPAADD